MKTNKILIQFMDQKKLTAYQIAKDVEDLTAMSISNYKKLKYEVPFSVLEKILNHYNEKININLH